MPTAPRPLILKLLLGAEAGLVSAREAIAACALFEIPESSARVALTRLCATEMVEQVSRGSYRLGPKARGLADDVRAWREAEARVRPWSGAFVAVHTSALGRSDRVALRQRERALALLGFRELEHELFVRPDNLKGGVGSVRTRLMKLGLDASAGVFLASEFESSWEARARGLWDEHLLTDSYTSTRDKLERWLTRSPKLGVAAAARESFLLGNAAIRQMVFDPLLPEPLVDVKARRAFLDTVVRFDREGQAIWKGFLTPLRERTAQA
jgi:phenylacetic acid degradation operon negative regulatory protein